MAYDRNPYLIEIRKQLEHGITRFIAVLLIIWVLIVVVLKYF